MLTAEYGKFLAFGFNEPVCRFRRTINNYSSQIKFYSTYFGAHVRIRLSDRRRHMDCVLFSSDDDDEGDDGIRIYPFIGRLPSNA